MNPKNAFRELEAGIMKYALVFILCALGTTLIAQQKDSLLHEVTVVDTRYQWLADAQFSVEPDSIDRHQLTTASLAGWLPLESSVHVRQYAPGMAATYSAHGATSSQNAVLWGGITINNPALGSTDLALLPASMFAPGMLRGGSAALFGTGAMGSVINLKQTRVQEGWHIQLGQGVGSFNTIQSSGKLSFSNNRIRSVTDASYSSSRNNYTFSNPYKVDEPTETRAHAAFQSTHFQQAFQFQINQKQYLDAAIWYNLAVRETPNSIITGADGSALLYDRALRSRIGWHLNSGRHKVDVVYAYIDEWQRFHDPDLVINNQPTDDTNTNNSHVLRADWLYAINEHWQLQSGVQGRYDDAGGGNRNGTQHMASIQSGIKYTGQLLHAQAVLRYEEWDGKSLPLSPFASLELPLPFGFKVTAFGGYNYRIPGMNDRFWNPGGNEDLLPEQGWSYEAALTYEIPLQKWIVVARMAYYESLVDNYILWMPAGNGTIWSPHNVRQVELSGVDADLHISWKHLEHIVEFKAGWAYNQSIVKASHNENDNSVGRQLTYQPEHKITGRLLYAYRYWSASLTSVFVGEVSTNYSESGHPLEAYNLFNIGIGYAFNVKKSTLSIQLAANNLTNTYYENIAFYPMPGRNYSLNLKFAL
jgi:vitamin B12 transporter